MTSKTSPHPTLIAVALLFGLTVGPAAESAAPTPAASAENVSFKMLDTDKDGYLSIKEFTAKGLDDLAFRAADVDSDGLVEPAEYDKYIHLKANDPKSGSGPAEPEKPGVTPPNPAPSPY